ncbi:VanZ family protein [Alkalihalobacillus sp. LMS39]|uniref:VanZ family protein n=1 Tax=Alkalihalobacillus sp. LMS39 TaxID=2924032 RepID=UPI001FB49F82|nr:VanZ family protein [Alkalihalobacillus sp. LMS39]UOE96563.1 VanZ family protein [Alkalihalobacillus sp. LMS39]
MKQNKAVPWLCVILWMALIFYLSHQPATESAELSTGIMQIIKQAVVGVIPQLPFDESVLHFLIRKGAHFFAYMILGILVYHALTKSNIVGVKRFSFTLMICVVYAITDEVHQLFIPGRSGEVTDVLIDSAGALVGIGVCQLVRKMIRFKNAR